MQAEHLSPIWGILQSLLRLAVPVSVAFYLVKISFLMGDSQSADK